MLFCHACQRQTQQPENCEHCGSDFIENIGDREFVEELLPEQFMRNLIQTIGGTFRGDGMGMETGFPGMNNFGTTNSNTTETSDGQNPANASSPDRGRRAFILNFPVPRTAPNASTDTIDDNQQSPIEPRDFNNVSQQMFQQ